MKLFKDINKRYGITMIQVTHDESMTLYGNRLIRLHDGIIVEDNYIDEVGYE